MEKEQFVWDPNNSTWHEQIVASKSPFSQRSASAPGSVVYRENAPTPLANGVYVTFVDAVNAINGSGVPTVLYIDGRFGQPVVPAGAYDLGLITLSEFPGQFDVSLNLLDGATFSAGPTAITNGLSLYSYSNSPIISYQNILLTLAGGSWLQTAGSGSFIEVPIGGTAQVFLDGTSYLAGTQAGATAPIINATSGSTFTGINVGEWSAVSTGALSGSGQIEVNLIASSATVDTQLSASSLFVYDANASASKDYSHFFALMPGDNSATVAVGTAVQFPQNGPSTGIIVRSGPSTFVLSKVGTYEVTAQVSVDEPGQLQLAIGGVGLPHTVVGRAAGTSQLVINAIFTTTVINSILSVINPSGNSTALTITPVAGGASPVSATLTIKQL